MPPVPAADALPNHPLREAFSWYLLQVYLRTLRESSDRTRLSFARRVIPETETADVIVHRLDEIAAQAVPSMWEAAGVIDDLVDALSRLPRAVGLPADKWDAGRIRETFYGLLSPADLVVSPAGEAGAADVKALLFEAAAHALVKREVVDATVGLAAELTLELPRFDGAALALSKRRLSHFCDAEAFAFVLRVRAIEHQAATGGRHGAPQWAREEANYRLAIARELDYVELFGADLSPEASRHGLSVAYVSLNLRNMRTEATENVPVTVSEMLDAPRDGAGRFLIRGAAGAGKSTLFRWIAMWAARGRESLAQVAEQFRFSESGYYTSGDATRRGVDTFSALTTETAVNAAVRARVRPLHVDLKVAPVVRYEYEPRPERRAAKAMRFARVRDVTQELLEWQSIPISWDRRTPFLLRLRDCSEGALPEPEAFSRLLSEGVGKPPAGLVESILTGGQGILLIDGVDEVPPSKRGDVEGWLAKVIARYPDNLILVSTRPEAVPDQWLSEQGFQEAWINPLSERDKREFIDKWHSAVGEQARAVGKPTANLTTLADELKKKLPSEPGINRLAEVPLLCAMICALHRDRHAKLPESQAELCDALSYVLLHRRELESGLDLSQFPAAYRSLSYEQKRAIVRELAYHMVDNERSVIEEPVASEIVRNMLGRFSGQDPAQAAVVCKSLVERSGMLREARPGLIDFIHNTFKEYLAAERFAETSSEVRLAKQAGEASWQPVIVFSAASRSPEFATRLVRELLKAPRRLAKTTRATQKAADADRRLRQLLALRCRQMAVQLDPDVMRELDEVMADLFPPRAMSDADALATGGQIAVQQLRYDGRRPANVTAASARTLRLIGTPQALEALDDYRQDMRMSVVNELLNVFNPFTLAVIQKTLLAGDPLPHAIARTIDSLAGIETLNGVESLALTNVPAVDLGPLASLTSLTELMISDDRVQRRDAPARDLSVLASLSNLRALLLFDCNVKNLHVLRRCKSLRTLYLSDTDVRNLDQILGFSKLQVLHLADRTLLDVSKIGRLKSLQSLTLIGAEIASVEPLAALDRLETLFLAHSNVLDLTPLAALRNLQLLNIRSTRPKSLRFVSKLPALRKLIVEGVESDDLAWVQEEGKRRGFEVVGNPKSNRSRKRSVFPPAERTPIDVALVIALDEEFDEVQKLFGADWESVPGGAPGEVDYRFRRPRASGVGVDECIAVLVGEMGPEATAMRVTSLLSKYAPKTLVHRRHRWIAQQGRAGRRRRRRRVRQPVSRQRQSRAVAARRGQRRRRGCHQAREVPENCGRSERREGSESRESSECDQRGWRRPRLCIRDRSRSIPSERAVGEHRAAFAVRLRRVLRRLDTRGRGGPRCTRA